MSAYIVKRILISIFVVFAVSIFSFMILQIMPGDPARLALGYEASEEDVQTLREKMNLDKPVVTQYILWVKGVARGDFGQSVIYKQPIDKMMAERVPRTLTLGIPALFIAAPLGIVVGVISAVRRGKPLDQILTFLTTVSMGMPVFWTGILSVFIFSVELKILPLQGYVSPSQDFGQYVYKAILPVFCMALPMIAGIARQTRTNMLDSINQDHIRTARANGLPERSIIFRHALKNAMIPIITVIGMQVRVVIGGSLLVEKVFNVAGLGTILTSSINTRDYIVVMVGVLIISLITVAVNLVVDILYGVIDPRIRLSRR
ncbi:peptide/nickel transport system permease protein [Sporobacter termitidis DSM 10068]|uniref:Peptide/nickel transport system permease protein n=1 Tax=Sporobacter termitidis DSM 10068 TaxID=1123282 RepID=A0A1M5YR56_9FIRM|nr:ABC transporter permease [Sporobacter termitidis]SHI14522.1 peptide/nickel transport system permease protein [Sporobacter termitidis DSM 10068]